MPRQPYIHVFLLAVVCLVVTAIKSQYSDWGAPDQTEVIDDSFVAIDWNGRNLGDEKSEYMKTKENSKSVSGIQSSDIGRRAAQQFYLRVLPLGASATEGTGSSDSNGYRKNLRDRLRFAGWKVNMVGTKRNGRMTDNDNEGHPGWTVTQVNSAFSGVKSMLPNVIFLNAGTNDCNFDVDTGNAGKRMKVFIDDILASLPDAVLIWTTLLPSRDKNPCAQDISSQYRALQASSYANQVRVQLGDVNSFLTLDDIGPDGIHPNDFGYKKMASVFWNAFRKAENVVKPPGNVTGIDDSAVASRNCTKVAGNDRGPIQTQKGSGHDDGRYTHSSQDRGALITGRIQKGFDPVLDNAIPSHMIFAQLINPYNAGPEAALDDWIRVLHGKDGKNTYFVRQNQGNGLFGSSIQFDVDQNCDGGPNYAWADYDGDGLADFWCLGPYSKVTLSMNRGGTPPKFESIGDIIGTHDGYISDDVRIGDIDGDGRADYCLLDVNGNLNCARNGGVGEKGVWQGFSSVDGLLGTILAGANKGDKAGGQLADLNGDGRADWMWLGTNGSFDTTINQRGWDKSIVPDWVSSGITHPGQAGQVISRDRVHLGRIFGSGRLDYILLNEATSYWEMTVLENKGAGGTRRKADGNFYCDLNGNGSDDYVWIYYDGHTDAGDIFTNIQAWPEWGHDLQVSLKVPGPRIGIHLADWDGDGKCDVLVQNKSTGALTLWQNQWSPGQSTVNFVNTGVVSGGFSCGEGWGRGIFDRGLRVADMDGDGRADPVCIEKNGRMTAWMNTKSGMVDAGQIKVAEGWERADIRLADVEGSGRSDILYLDKYTGATTVFTNAGKTPGGQGCSFSWTKRGVLYSGVSRGENLYFPNFGGLGRADLHYVLPASNAANTYFNECGGGSGGDDGPIVDPGLPGDDGPTSRRRRLSRE